MTLVTAPAFCDLSRSKGQSYCGEMKQRETMNSRTQAAQIDFNEKPFVVIWETTQACDLACVHCRACAQPLRSPQELTTEEARKFIHDVADLEPPIFIFTGG